MDRTDRTGRSRVLPYVQSKLNDGSLHDTSLTTEPDPIFSNYVLEFLFRWTEGF